MPASAPTVPPESVPRLPMSGLADPSEIERLRRSYGFYPEIHAELLARLVGAGLKEIASFAYGEDQLSYGTLYEVPRDE